MDRPTYQADEVSHVELIACDFERSRRWSLIRHNRDVVKRVARKHQARDAVAGVLLALGVAAILIFLKATLGEL